MDAIMKYLVEQQTIQSQQHNNFMQSITQLIQASNVSKEATNPALTTVEFTIESLSNVMTEFTYDPESGQWFNI